MDGFPVRNLSSPRSAFASRRNTKTTTKSLWTKTQIEDFPPYNEKDLETDNSWSDYETRYRAKWDDGPVMHREGSDRNITPPASQIPVARNVTPIDSASAAANERIIPAGADAVVIENTAVGIGGRWDTFQSRLRERRKQSAFGGPTTAGGESAEIFARPFNRRSHGCPAVAFFSAENWELATGN